MPAVSEAIDHWSTAVRCCQTCGSRLVLRSVRDVSRKRFCSKVCRVAEQRGRRAIPLFREARKCEHCGIDYIAVVKKQRYCSTRCTASVIGLRSRQRHNDLESHLKRLLVYKGRSALSLTFLVELYAKQEGRCALSGISMTWGMGSGRVNTHLSIDRIDSSRGYSEDNVQLVCNIVNRMKLDLSQDAFAAICAQVVETTYASIN